MRRGRAEIAQALRKSSELFDSSRHEIRELFDFGDAGVATEAEALEAVALRE